MKSHLVVITVFCTYFASVIGHSALSCTQKVGEKCVGFPRYYHFNHLPQALPSSSNESQFFASRDRQFLSQPGINNVCPQMTIKAYTKEFPMARGRPGRNLTLGHPPRGHAAQPSSNVFIYMHPKVNVFPNRTAFGENEFNLLAQFPFDKCDGLEKEVSWANCTGTIQIPKNASRGIYTFWWKWELSGVVYNDCFEVFIQSSKKLH